MKKTEEKKLTKQIRQLTKQTKKIIRENQDFLANLEEQAKKSNKKNAEIQKKLNKKILDNIEKIEKIISK